MALIFDQIADTPQTHILIIGVGKYPYLKGGEHAQDQTVDYLKNIGQLTSTSISAKAFLDSMLDIHAKDCWITPLGSIELLLDIQSETTGEQEPNDIANLDSVEKAYLDWKDRCGTNSANTAIFYFAGHGFTVDNNLHLALADIGKDPRLPWKSAVNFTSLRAAFHGCKADNQLFFVDACRDVPIDSLTTKLAVSLIDDVSKLQGMCTHDLTLYATAQNSSAYGPKDQVSYFTSALLNGLKGAGVTNDGEHWVINTGTISKDINGWMGEDKQTEQGTLRCRAEIAGPINIIKFKEVPEAHLTVICNPTGAINHADLRCFNENYSYKRGPNSKPWELTVKAGIYQISARFKGKHYKKTTVLKNIIPPNNNHKLECKS
ncbi:MAG: hypothetical protein EOO20_02845 [Chryseobacterium sp.]|uniref:caspase family protein n=1 Tax=Pedobacter agri TaxID=454586 RepID=UPI0011F61D07|nr:caspase family protein [Pedobacter agri]RZJ92124.1 MAG: hypothetical protein EOO20_02845 [Chryseobacterium sp.]